MKALTLLLSSTQSSFSISRSPRSPPRLDFLNLFRLFLSCSKSSAMFTPISILFFSAKNAVIERRERIQSCTCILTQFLQCLCQPDLGLNLCFQLLHLPQVLHHLPPGQKCIYVMHNLVSHLPDYLYDSGCKGQPQQDVHGAYHHVEALVWK